MLENFIEHLNSAICICDSYLNFNYNKFYLSSEQYLRYQHNLINNYSTLSESEKRNAKKDELASLLNSKVYLSELKENNLELIILDSEKNLGWYKEKLIQIDKIMRRINTICKSHFDVSLIIYVDSYIKQEYLSKYLSEFIFKNKGVTPSESSNERVILNYFNSNNSIYFIRKECSVRINSANRYFDKCSKENNDIIHSDELLIEHLL